MVEQLSLFARWRHALKIGSWPKLLVPTFFGQTLALADVTTPSLGAAIFAFAFTLAQLVFIVLLNDYGDREVDTIKRQLFPDGCSPKTLPDGILSERAVLVGGIAAGLAAMGVAFAAAWVLERPLAPWIGLACLGLFIAYTLPPLRLNYRGGGELLEALGVGAMLPLFGAYLASGRVVPSLLFLVPGYVLLSLSSAVASGLSDEASDRRGGKRTLTTTLGNLRARRVVEASFLLGALAWIVPLAFVEVPGRGWTAALVIAVTLRAGWQLMQRSAAATTNAFRAQAAYKEALHGALWRGTLLLCLALVVGRLLET